MSMSSAHADSEKKHLPETNWGEPENAFEKKEEKKEEGTEKRAEGKAGTKQAKSKTDGPLRITWKQTNIQKKVLAGKTSCARHSNLFERDDSSIINPLVANGRQTETGTRAAPPTGGRAQRRNSRGSCIETDWVSAAQKTQTAALDQVSDEGEMWRVASAQGSKLFSPLSFRHSYQLRGVKESRTVIFPHYSSPVKGTVSCFNAPP